MIQGIGSPYRDRIIYKRRDFASKQAYNSPVDNFVSFRGKENEVKSIKKILKNNPDIIKKLNQNTIDPQVLKVKKAFKNPQILEKLFEDENIVKKLASYAENGDKTEETGADSRVSFGQSIFRQNPFWGGKTIREKARNIRYSYSLATGLVGGLGSQIPMADSAALAVSTTVMVKKLAKLYDIPWSKNLAAITTAAIAGGVGASAGTGCVQWVPVGGNIINGTWAYSINKIIGNIFISLFESQKAGDINIEKISAKSITKKITSEVKNLFKRSSDEEEETERKKARKIIRNFSMIGGGIGAAASQIPGSSLIGLPLETTLMVKKLADVYDIPWNNKMNKFALVAAETGLEATLGTTFLKYIPVLGNMLSGTALFIINRSIGYTFIKLFEAHKKGKEDLNDIRVADLKRRILGSIKILMNHAEKDLLTSKLDTKS